MIKHEHTLYKFRQSTSTLKLYSVAHLKDNVLRLGRVLNRLLQSIRFEEPASTKQYKHWLRLRILVIEEIERINCIVKGRVK